MSSNLTIKGRLLALLAGTCLTIFAGEAGLRLFLKDWINLFPRYHTDAVYGDFTIRRLRPNMTFWHTSVDGTWKFVTNTQGFRDERDFTYEKRQAGIRIVTLGDSMTQGFEVHQERTYSAAIERYLNGHDVKARVLNMGVSGFSTAEELVLLGNEAIKYKPDVVVLGFFANDFQDNIKAGLFLVENGEFVSKKKRHTPGVRILNIVNEVAMLRWLSENSYLYAFTMNGVWNLAKRLLLTRAKGEIQTEYALPTEELNDYMMELAGLLIQEMYAFCRRNGIRFIIIDIPRRAASGWVQSSVPAELLETMRVNSDEFVHSEKVLAKHSGVADFHVPHGQRHISEFTHRILGEETGRLILGMVGKP